MEYNVVFWPFDPAKNVIPRWCTGRKWHILMAVMRGNRVGGNWLMKWDELKKFPWYTHRLMHRKRVTSELPDSYSRLMTIKHSISKIEWASKDYISELSSTASCWVELKIGRSWRRDVVRKATPGRRGPRGALMNWGPENMLIRCSKKSQHPVEWTPGLRLSSPVERERPNADGYKFGGQNIAVMFDLQLPLTVKSHTTFWNPCNKVRGKYC